MNQLRIALDARLHLVTGKGGVGRTSFAVALGGAMARRGHRTLILEPQDPDGGDSMLGRMLNTPQVNDTPHIIQPNLLIGQLIARVGHDRFLRSIIPIQRLIKAALDSKPLSRFLRSAPSMYELGLFYHLWLIIQEGEYDRIILDLPATGHTLALTQLPSQIERIIKRGHIVDSLKRGSQFISDPQHCSAWVVTLPERLPVSEALDLSAALLSDQVQTAGFILNRAPLISLTPLERALIKSFYQKNPTAQGVRVFERYDGLDQLKDELSQVAFVLTLSESSRPEDRVLEILDGWFDQTSQVERVSS